MESAQLGEKLSCGKFFFEHTKMAPLWLLVRLYVGWTWLSAGWGKVTNPIWFGGDAGGAITGFVTGALAKTAGEHPDVSSWYGSFLEQVVLAHPLFWSHLVAGGEFLVGLALVLGFLTGISAFWGAFMNLNFMLAGAVSINPILYTLSILLMLAWKISGHIGLDRFILPRLTQWCKKNNPV